MHIPADETVSTRRPRRSHGPLLRPQDTCSPSGRPALAPQSSPGGAGSCPAAVPVGGLGHGTRMTGWSIWLTDREPSRQADGLASRRHRHDNTFTCYRWKQTERAVRSLRPCGR